MTDVIGQFFGDTVIQVVLLMVVIDLAVGLCAAVKLGEFRLAYLADFLRNDVLGKVIPLLILYAGLRVAEDADIVIPGLAIDGLTWAAYATVVGALAGSILKSLRDLGLMPDAVDRAKERVVDAIAGPDPGSPL